MTEQLDLFDDVIQPTEAPQENPPVEELEGEKTSETPTEDIKPQEPAEKMIPEHRFKAALKDVSDKLTLAQQELAELKAAPIPDKEKDPEGYEVHTRIEISKQIMRDNVADYDEVIQHYVEMVKEAPHINTLVMNHKNPAKHAYDLAKKDLEIRELTTLKSSDEWKEFQEYKKARSLETASKVVEKPVEKQQKIPNLNRATNVNRQFDKKDDDDLFAGAL